jgi:hypothetical protein
MGRNPAVVGVSDHAGWAVLITATPDGDVVDRRRITLVDGGLPVMPHHHDAQGLPADEGVALVERVRASAERCARAALDALAGEVAVPIRGIALRVRPALPPTIAERITDYRAQCVADWVMYREALAGAAQARDWAVTWYDARVVLAEAAAHVLRAAGKALGPPWQKDHRVAMAAALAACRPR